MKRFLLVVAGFFALTLVLAVLWEEGGGRIAYGRFTLPMRA